MRRGVYSLASLLLSAAACDGSIFGGSPDPRSTEVPPDPGPTPFTAPLCDDPSATGATDLLRLSKAQYVNTLTDLFGAAALAQVASAVALLPEDSGRPDSLELSTLSNERIASYFDIAQQLAKAVTASDTLTAAVFGGAATAASPTASCLDGYLSQKAVQIFRRPLTAAELAEARSIAAPTSGPYCARAALKQVLARHLQAPAFVLRLELGDADDDAPRFTLTPYEVATRIAYATTDSGPDAALLSAASGGALATPAQIEGQVRRLLATPRGQEKARAMFRVWLQQLSSVEFTALPAALTDGMQMGGLETAIKDETDRYIDYVLWEQNGGYRDLLTSKASFASHVGLAAIYGHAPADPNRAPGSPTAEMAGRRQGLLMRSSYLAGAKSRTNPVSRGVRLRRLVMCDDLPDPSQDLVNTRLMLEPTDEERLQMTTRTYISTLTASAACQACHSKINPTGFAFEGFDPLGRVRTEEQIFDATGTRVRSLPVDASGEVPLWAGTREQVTDAYDLVGTIAESPQGAVCFARNAFRYFQQRREVDADSCRLAAMYAKLTSDRPSIVDAFVASIANDVSATRQKGP